MMRILGVDPGHKDVALVVRDGDQLIFCESLIRSGQDRAAWAMWCAGHVIAHTVGHEVQAVGVEDVSAPNPHVGRRTADGQDRSPKFIDVAPLLDTMAVAATVYATVLTELRDVHVVMVEPSGFGAPLPSRRHLLSAYPSELVGPRERTGAGKTVHQHLRAAFDVAGATPRLVRARAVEAGTG